MGRVTLECTTEHKLGAIDEFDCECAAPPPCMACRFGTLLRANGEPTDDAKALRPTPPCPPFTRGGKARAYRPLVRNKNTRLAIDTPTQSVTRFQQPVRGRPKTRSVPRSGTELVELGTRTGERVIALFGHALDRYAETIG